LVYEKTQWAVCIGFNGEHLAKIRPVVERLKKQYPDQEFRIYNSKFPQYTFLLVTFAKDRDSAHKIGLALVKKELPLELHLLYWCKEIKSLKDVVQEG
jgi:hypothetical protein